MSHYRWVALLRLPTLPLRGSGIHPLLDALSTTVAALAVTTRPTRCVVGEDRDGSLAHSTGVARLDRDSTDGEFDIFDGDPHPWSILRRRTAWYSSGSLCSSTWDETNDRSDPIRRMAPSRLSFRRRYTGFTASPAAVHTSSKPRLAGSNGSSLIVSPLPSSLSASRGLTQCVRDGT